MSILALAGCGGGGGGGGGTNAPPTGSVPTPPPAPAPTPPPPIPPPPVPTVQNPALIAIFDQAESRFLDLNPLDAQLRGVDGYASRFGDYVSDAWYDAVRTLAEENLASLSQVSRVSLTSTDRVAYDAFEYQQRQTLVDFEGNNLAINRARPLNHMTGLHTYYPSIVSGNGALPFNTLQDYEDNIPRTREFAAFLDAVIDEYRDGAAAGLYQPRLVVSKVIEQIDAILAQPVRQSRFYGPINRFPGSISSTNRTRLANEYEALIRDTVYPAYRRLRNYLNDEYLPHARSSVGLVGLPNGAAYYDYIIEKSTTQDLTAEEVHQLGESEVERILGEMNAIRVRQGFSGSLDAFVQSLARQSQNTVSGRSAIVAFYRNIARDVDPRLAALFARQPRSALQIVPYDTFTEQFIFAASYEPGSPDGSRPGTFYFNASAGTVFTPPLTSIYLHEGEPGHHFQISLAQENTSLPAFMRFGGPTAYVEGWALYAETLGDRMGLYDDEIVLFGHLTQELLRALRLVVDTGIHGMGWSRQQAINYVVEHSTYTASGIAPEIDRYIAIPGQALGYKIGELEILRLERRSRRLLGGNYDIRLFHDQVLNTGALPLPILTRKINDWIAAEGG